MKSWLIIVWTLGVLLVLGTIPMNAMASREYVEGKMLLVIADGTPDDDNQDPAPGGPDGDDPLPPRVQPSPIPPNNDYDPGDTYQPYPDPDDEICQ